jgi:PPK2 family polyphosphate:nucleotide phosphotransferase
MSHHIHLSGLTTLPLEKITAEESLLKISSLHEKLARIQDKLFAQEQYSVLIILQGMDTSGKDGAVKNVFTGVNPAGCQVKSFKAPTAEEASHHFLWRVSKECPQKGMIKIFNRSHYEDILVPIVEKLLDESLVMKRCEEINLFERGLIQHNTILMKFYLHVSHEEQLRRLEARRNAAHKRWKYHKEDDIAISKHEEYKRVYELIFKNCSQAACWQIIPADKKWYRDYILLKLIVEELEKYDIRYPEISLE